MSKALSVRDCLIKYPPFGDLDDELLTKITEGGGDRHFSANEVILRGEKEKHNFLWIILKGQVRILTPRKNADFDDYVEKLYPGDSFGFVAAINPDVAPPKAVAVTDVDLVTIPAELVRPIFSTPAGAKYLANQLQYNIEKPSIRRVTANKSGIRTARDLLKKPVLKCNSNISVQEAAKLMTERNSGYIIAESVEKGVGILTDYDIRSKLVAAAKSCDTPVKDFMTFPAKTISVDASPFDLMLYMLDNNLNHLPVLDENDTIIGVVTHRDFLSAPSSSSFLLNKKIVSASLEELKIYYSQLVDLNFSMFEKHYPVTQISELSAIVIENIISRCIELVISDYEDLDANSFSWLTLGSVARREVMLTSDIESALCVNDFPKDTEKERLVECRKVAKKVHENLNYIGLVPDSHGALGEKAGFAKTYVQWHEIAKKWIKDPLNNHAMIKSSLMFDARPIWGANKASPVAEEYRNIRKHPKAYKLMLQEALTAKAKKYSLKEGILLGQLQLGKFNIKTHALLPIVNLARWAALSVGSEELSTIHRLKAASGHGLITEQTSSMLIEVFNIVQRIRFQNYMRQMKNNETPSDMVSLKKISAFDKTLLMQAIREVAFIQKKMVNMLQYTDSNEWG